MSKYTPEQIEQACFHVGAFERTGIIPREARNPPYKDAHGQDWALENEALIILAVLEAAEEELKEYESLISLQYTRTIKAGKLWQKAHSPQKHIYPDLGQLIDWLLDEISGWRNRAVMAEKGFANAVQASDTQTKRIKQLLDERDALAAYAAKLEKAGDDMLESSDGSILHCDAIRDWDAARKEKP